MTRTPTRPSRARVAALFALGTAAVVVACSIDPTAPSDSNAEASAQAAPAQREIVRLPVDVARLETGRLVPTRAIIERDGRDLLFIVRNDRAQWTYIVRGDTRGGLTEVLPDTAGANAGRRPTQDGDVVITDGHLTLIHDAPVRVR